MTSIELFNGLNGKTVSRNYLEQILQQAKAENQTAIVYRLSKVLNDNPKYKRFEMTIRSYPHAKGLAGIQHTGDYREALDDCGRLRKGWKFVKGSVVKVEKQKVSTKKIIENFGLYGLECLSYNEQEDELKGLGTPVTPKQIYKMITDKIIASMKQATGKDYVKKWKTKTQSFFVPINFETKKPYRGINFLMLKADLSDGIFGVFENPYFLTFKQVEKLKGKVKKGAKGKEVIYFTYHYSVFVKENGKKKTLFKTFDIKEAREFLKEKGLSEESNLERFAILKYYKVFNGADIEGVDFKLPQVEIGKMIPEDSLENRAAELIVKNYPNPPKINHGGSKAYYHPDNDYVQMPPFGDFETTNDYYRTLFHELTHSTGHEKRLNREFSGRFGSKSYAQEELVAEFGAVFLSAFAGFVWHTNKNHTEYLKNWNSVFKIAEDDHKFLMRGASMAQEAADYVLNMDENGEPKFYKDLAKKSKTCNKSKVKGTENHSDYLDELYQKMLKLDPRAKPLLYKEVAKKFDIHLLFARFFHEQSRIYDGELYELILLKGVETEMFDKMFAKDFDRFFTHKESVFRGKREFVHHYYNDFSKEIGAYIFKRQNWKKYGLAAPQPQLSTDDFKKMTVKELREFTLQYYLQNLKGKKVAVKDFIKEVVFTTKAGRKIAHGEAMYKEKAVAIKHLEQLIKNSTYNNWGDRKPQDNPNILGYLNFKSKLIIDGEKKHLRIAVVLDKDRNFELKSFDVGKKKNSQVPQGALPSAEGTQLFQNKGTKKSVSNKKTAENFGLGLPLTDEIRKKAFTDKGKLRKGWYYDEYGLLTDGKEFYHSDKKSWAELENIRIYAVDKRGKQIDALYKGAEMKQSLENDQDYLKKLDFEEKLIKKYQIAEREFDILKRYLRNVELGRFDFYFPNSDHKRWFKQEFNFRKKNEFVEKVVGKDEFHLTDKGLKMFQEYKDFSDKLNAERKREYNKYKQKYGLAAPIPVVETTQEPMSSESAGPQVFVEEFTEPTQVQPESVNPLPEVAHHRKGSLAEQLANAPTQTESYQIDRVDMAQFLGDMEIKNTDSLVITLTGGQGSGKTRFAFQFMNDLAQRYKVGHISIEEHPESRLYIEKAHQYLNQNALNNIEAHDVRSLSEIDKIIRENEVIVIDSFQKIKEIDSKFEVDKDLRKKYNGKLFLVIFQQTTDGKMRGGSKSQFDGDIILFTEKFPNYQENYVYPDKNRYNHIPADQLKYNIFQQRLLPVETEEQTIENQVYDVIY
ncbi:zincin-like metallopeptidase domain-containing protein [Capnocytophaga canis]|uniref:zincin-like metallopeptidase domain-containing protein n=1 Tax=Capnocytophaga canis TaxID=1848903 RepID=UPI00370DE100